MNRKHPTAVKRVVFVTIAGLEQIEMFEQRDKNSSKTIKEDIKLQISNMLDIPAAKIIDFSLDTLMFNIVSYFNDEELIKILQIQSPLIHSKFETTFLIGMASYNDVFCNRKVQRIATKNTECCHPILSLFSRQCIG